jgi:hypothetical protein
LWIDRSREYAMGSVGREMEQLSVPPWALLLRVRVLSVASLSNRTSSGLSKNLCHLLCCQATVVGIARRIFNSHTCRQNFETSPGLKLSRDQQRLFLSNSSHVHPFYCTKHTHTNLELLTVTTTILLARSSPSHIP